MNSFELVRHRLENFIPVRDMELAAADEVIEWIIPKTAPNTLVQEQTPTNYYAAAYNQNPVSTYPEQQTVVNHDTTPSVQVSPEPLNTDVSANKASNLGNLTVIMDRVNSIYNDIDRIDINQDQGDV